MPAPHLHNAAQAQQRLAALAVQLLLERPSKLAHKHMSQCG